MVKAPALGPVVEGSCCALHVVRGEVPLAEAPGHVAVLGQDARESGAAPWLGSGVAGERPRVLRDRAEADAVLAGVHTEQLTDRDDFDWKNPNRFRSVIGALTANHAGFHHRSGSGYRLVANWLIRLDPLNPQTTARMSTAFDSWRRYDLPRRKQARTQLARIQATPGLSDDLHEMVDRMLSGS